MYQNDQNNITLEQAEKILSGIQSRGKPVTKRVFDARASVRPLDGNAFEITLDMSLPRAAKAADRLNDVGADIQPYQKPWPKTGFVRVIVTWDTMLHYLAMTGDLS